jgi:hypothetical protein
VIDNTASSAATPSATPMIEIKVIIETVALFFERKYRTPISRL